MENGKNLDTRVQNLELRFVRVEQILPTLATRDDLGDCATKADLDRFATKVDLERFATRVDLEHELRSMREFVLEPMAHMHSEMAEERRLFRAEGEAIRRASREELGVLIEAERDRWTAVIDPQNRAYDELGRVEQESRARDGALDVRVTRLEDR